MCLLLKKLRAAIIKESTMYVPISIPKHRLHHYFFTIGLSIQDIREDVLINSWESFITTIDVSALNPILGQVIACLLHLPGDRKAILKLCLNLLVDKKESLKNSFSQLNFVPEDWQQLAKIIREENEIGPPTEFKLILKLVTNSLSNENNDVKILTLEKILDLLKLNQEKLQGLVLLGNFVLRYT